MKHHSLLLLGLVAACASATFAGAQSMTRSASTPTAAPATASAVRSGFYISAGGGFGSAGLDCDGCTSDRESSVAAYIRLGGTLNPHLRLGVESEGWAKTVNGVDEQVGFFTADLYVYPSVTNNFWIRGGFGVAASKESDDQDDAKSTGPAVAVGIGYDWNVGGGNFVIAPYASYNRQLSGKIKLDGNDTGISANANLLQIGVGLGYRH